MKPKTCLDVAVKMMLTAFPLIGKTNLRNKIERGFCPGDFIEGQNQLNIDACIEAGCEICWRYPAPAEYQDKE